MTAGHSRHVSLLRRRAEGKTDYRRRKAVVIARKPLICVRVGVKNILVQVLKAEVVGDKVLASAHSRELLKYGWKGSRKNLPAAYLTGLLAGSRALMKGVSNAVFYSGVKPYIRGFRGAAVVKGMLDTGLSIAVEEETLPSEERLKGGHIALYAKTLHEKDKGLYEATFARLLSSGFKPEDYPKHFLEVKEKLLAEVKKT